MNRTIQALTVILSAATIGLSTVDSAPAVSIVLEGESIEIFTRSFPQGDFIFRSAEILPSLQRTPWWGNRDLAAAAAAQLEDQLGTVSIPDGRGGPFFAYQLSDDRRGVFGARWESLFFPFTGESEIFVNTEARSGVFPRPGRPITPRPRTSTTFAVIPEPKTMLGSLLTLGLLLALKRRGHAVYSDTCDKT